MKKIILAVLAASSLLLYSIPSFAFSLSVGIPMSQTITGKLAGKSYGNVPDKTSGYFLAVQLPFAIGLGIDSYTTKFKTDDSDGAWGPGGDASLKTNMTNIFYQLPVPVVNLIIGLGMGTTEYDCTYSDTTCSAAYDKGSATQWYTSIGIPLIPLFDIHLSYRSITAKNIKNKDDGRKHDNSGSVTGIGLALNF